MFTTQLYKKVFVLLSSTVFFHTLALPQNLPSPYSVTTNINYVRAWEANAPETNPAALIFRPLKDVKQTTTYADGLGRTLQMVIKQGAYPTNGSPVDLVNSVVYDEFGHEVYKYLPFAANNTGNNISINDGLFKLNPFQQQVTFMQQQYSGQNETFYYDQVNYEPSPLNRIAETFAPGNSWAGTAGLANESDRHSRKLKYYVNTSIDEVRIWEVTDVLNGFGAYSSPSGSAGIYPAGTLFKTVAVDEKGTQTIEFKDKEGKVVLKKVQLTASPDNGSGSPHSNWLCTYYIYDNFDLLRAVIQPKGVEQLPGNGWQLSSSLLDEQCFRYEYDSRKRMIMKKVPGAGEIQMIYDAKDRLVMMQNGNMRLPSQMNWVVTQYDDLNRPVATYKITDPTNYNNPVWHRQQSSGTTSYPNIFLYTNELLTETHYDNYNGIPSEFSVTNLYASGYGPYLDALASDYPEPLTISPSVKDLITWTKVKVLGESKYITSCNIYDEKKRIVQIQTINYTGAMDIVTNQYSFSGLILRSHIKHQKGSPNAQSYDLGTKNSYDDPRSKPK